MIIPLGLGCFWIGLLLDWASWIRLLGLGYFARNRFKAQLRKFLLPIDRKL